jgi:hypothetical protein
MYKATSCGTQRREIVWEVCDVTVFLFYKLSLLIILQCFLSDFLVSEAKMQRILMEDWGKKFFFGRTVVFIQKFAITNK